MRNKKYVYTFMALALFTTLATASSALAETNTPNQIIQHKTGKNMINRNNIRPDVFGTVSAVSGNIITVSSSKRGVGVNTTATITTYTIDVTNAKITKNNVVESVSSVIVGDIIMAKGTLTGTNLVATTVQIGQIGKGMRGGPNQDQTGKTAPVSPITGNGQPVVAGTVSSINGATIVITNKSNVSYTVDATNAKIVQGQNTITISSIVVGDEVVIQGTVNGNAIVATSVIDQNKVANTTATSVKTTQNKGFFGSIGAFFGKIFGF
jgi:hypothetical protein